MKSFEPLGDAQNSVMDGTAKTITIARLGDASGTVYLVNIGTQTIFVRLDGTVPTTSNGAPLLAGSAQTMSMPTGSTTVKSIGTAGSTLYVVPGRGL